jgi:STE24 endopeptidase
VNEERSSRYHRLRRRAAVASIGLTGATLVLLVATGASAVLRDVADWLTGTGQSSASTLAVYVLFVVGIHEAVTLPVTFYQSFQLERRFGLSSESLRGWVLDHVKAACIMLFLALCGAELVYATIERWPDWWWLLSAIGFIVATVLLAKVAPVLLLPVFYRFTPLDREELRARLISLCSRAGLPVLGVYVWGLGEKTRRANAALVGTGATRRILVSDTLLSDFTEDEIEVILAHELGHHRHGDVRSGLLAESARLILAFGAAAVVLRVLWPACGFLGPWDIAGLPLLLLAGGTASLVSTPILNALSRHNERRADRYALELTGRSAAFVSAMRRLAAQNLAEERPSKPAVWLFHTHPPIEQRILSAQRFGD